MSGGREEGLGRVEERSAWTDGRLQRELVDVLRSREPGTAPLGLRLRVAAIPDEQAASGLRRLPRGVAPLLAAAAILAVAIVAGQALRVSVPLVGPAASPVPSPSAFDPKVVGPGVAPAAELGGYGTLVLLGSGLLVLFAIAIRGWRRLIPAAGAALLLAWGLVGTFYPVSISWFHVGPGIGVIGADMPAGVDLQQYYVTASPEQPFSVALGLGLGDGPRLLPIRLDGIVGEPGGPAGPQADWTAVWLDTERNGYSRAPGSPFRPFDLNGPPQSLWLIGRAGWCAVGPSFDQRSTAGVEGFGSIVPVVRISILGWPRTVELREPVVVEPDVQSCVAARPSPANPASSSSH